MIIVVERGNAYTMTKTQMWKLFSTLNVSLNCRSVSFGGAHGHFYKHSYTPRVASQLSDTLKHKDPPPLRTISENIHNRPSKSFKALQNIQLEMKSSNFEWNIDMNMAFEIQYKEHKYSPPP